MVNEVGRAYYRPDGVPGHRAGGASKIEASTGELDLGPIRTRDREGNLLDTNTDYSSR